MQVFINRKVRVPGFSQFEPVEVGFGVSENDIPAELSEADVETKMLYLRDLCKDFMDAEMIIMGVNPLDRDGSPLKDSNERIIKYIDLRNREKERETKVFGPDNLNIESKHPRRTRVKKEG
jgi:hypothetical protein